MNRSSRKTLAQQTLDILDAGGYDTPVGRVDLAEDTRSAVDEARLLTPDALVKLARQPVEPAAQPTAFGVENTTTLDTARRLAADLPGGTVLTLNFASAKNPGGGFLGGSQAQEESLARSSALYPTLTACREYYDINRNSRTALYTDHMIYSPNVPVFRDDAGTLLDEPYMLSFLTAPAVNTGAVKRNEPGNIEQVVPAMRRRVGYVLAAAAALGHRHLVLGAWGCGVFRNDPEAVASLFAEQLHGGAYARAFERVVFAVLDRHDETIIAPFRERFGSESIA